MAVNKNRAYQRALALYQARTGIAPVDSDRNIIQDIVQAILEEIDDHFQAVSGIPVSVSGSITVTGGSVSFTATGSTTAAADLEQV
jgi:predicted NBD/HSP70 family sugar kinase